MDKFNRSLATLIISTSVLLGSCDEPPETYVASSRPVMMAASTTILGMAPLLSDVFFLDMAVVIMFGLGFASALTLIVVPVLYAIFFNIKANA